MNNPVVAACLKKKKKKNRIVWAWAQAIPDNKKIVHL
jgi:hypothetical protein